MGRLEEAEEGEELHCWRSSSFWSWDASSWELVPARLGPQLQPSSPEGTQADANYPQGALDCCWVRPDLSQEYSPPLGIHRKSHPPANFPDRLAESDS